MLNCQQAFPAEAIGILLCDIMPLGIMKRNTAALAFSNIACFTFKQAAAARAGLGLMMWHTDKDTKQVAIGLLPPGIFSSAA